MLWYVVAATFFLWLSILTYLFLKSRKHYLNLSNRTGKHSIDEILDKLLEDDNKLQKDSVEIRKHIKEIVDKSRFHFQKIGVIRFNAFGRTGNDQSFALAMLNGESSGLIINFIYTHEGIRVYTKKVKQGKGEEYQLTDEEQRAINESK